MKTSAPAPPPAALPPATTLWGVSSASAHLASISTKPLVGARTWMNAPQAAAPAVTAAPTRTEGISAAAPEATSERDKGKRAASTYLYVLGDVAGCRVRGAPRNAPSPRFCSLPPIESEGAPVNSHSHMSPQLLHAGLFLTHHKILMLMCISSPVSLIRWLAQLLAL